MARKRRKPAVLPNIVVWLIAIVASGVGLHADFHGHVDTAASTASAVELRSPIG